MDLSYESVLWDAINQQFDRIAARLSDPTEARKLLDELDKRFFALLIFEDVYRFEQHKEQCRSGAQKTNRKRAMRRPDYATAVKRLMDAGVRYTPACESVANQFGVTWQTIRNQTPTMRPGRRLKKR